MLVLLSPSKTLSCTPSNIALEHSQPVLLEHSKILASELKKLAPEDIGSLMGISQKLATLNYERFQKFSTPFSKDNASAALFTFKGDVYEGLEADTLKKEDVIFSQKTLRILSGLYGILRPLDFMQPYRLEMGTKMQNPRGKNLYEFWKNTLTTELNHSLSDTKHHAVINLASQEYFSAVDTNMLQAHCVTPVFKEHRNGIYKVIGLFAKKARGKMARYIVTHRLSKPEDLKAYNEDGYRYNQELSDENTLVFTRG